MCNVPALQIWMESAFTSSDMISEVSSFAESDIRDVDLKCECGSYFSNSRDVSSSGTSQGDSNSRDVSSSGTSQGDWFIIEWGHAPTMDNLRHVVNVLPCATSQLHIQCAAPCTQYKCSSASAGSGAHQELEHQSACSPALL